VALFLLYTILDPVAEVALSMARVKHSPAATRWCRPTSAVVDVRHLVSLLAEQPLDLRLVRGNRPA
jgi:hypothetical protein